MADTYQPKAMPLPQLQADGSNWMVWKTDLEILAATMDWSDYLNNKKDAPSPVEYMVTTADTPEHSIRQNEREVERYQKELKAYRLATRTLVLTIFTSLPDELKLELRTCTSPDMLFANLKSRWEDRPETTKAWLFSAITNIKMVPKSSIRSHLDQFRAVRQKFISMGGQIDDGDFMAHVMNSLPLDWKERLITFRDLYASTHQSKAPSFNEVYTHLIK
jgi:hypothetical protein